MKAVFFLQLLICLLNLPVQAGLVRLTNLEGESMLARIVTLDPTSVTIEGPNQNLIQLPFRVLDEESIENVKQWLVHELSKR